MEQLDYSELQDAVEQLLPGDFPVTFEELLESLLSGEHGGLAGIAAEIAEWFFTAVTFPVEQGVRLLLLILFSSLFSNLSKAFSRDGTAHMGLLCVHLLLATHMATMFSSALAVTAEGMENLCTFVTVLLPTYCISVAMVTGSVTAVGYYQGTAFLLGVFQFLARFCLLPLAQSYLILSFASCVQKKPVFEKLLELIVQLFGWIRKTLLAVALAFGAVQGILCPAIDQLKRNTLIHSASVIPGVGNLVGGAWETVLGAGTILRNAIGIGGVVILFLIAALPICHLALQCLLYRILGAVTEPLAQNITMNLLQHAGTAQKLLLQTISLGMLLFLLLLVVMTRIST